VPQFLEDKLKQSAAKKGLKGKNADRYVWGAMNNLGAVKGNVITAKGRAMERKHNEHLADRSRLRGLDTMRAA